jgi:twitching motility protein PilI
MSISLSPSHIFSILKDIEQRSHRHSAGQGNQLDFWTAIGFRIADQHFVIPLQQTLEVFPVPSQISSVPKAESWVFGIANLRGELLPLFDLKQFLSNKPTKLTTRSRIMVINHPDIYSGVLVDEVFGLKHFQQDPSPLPQQPHDPLAEFLTGQIEQQNTYWKVFSFEKLATDSRFLNAAA